MTHLRKVWLKEFAGDDCFFLKHGFVEHKCVSIEICKKYFSVNILVKRGIEKIQTQIHNKPSLPSPWATTLGSVYSGLRPNSQLNQEGKNMLKLQNEQELSITTLAFYMHIFHFTQICNFF